MTQYPHPASMVMTRIGGQDYPLRSEPNCKTCQSPQRTLIENELVKGRSYAVIRRELEGLPAGDRGHPSAEAISDHVKNGHIPIGASLQRRLIERRAKDIGRNIETAEESLVDYVTVQQMIVSKGFERLQDGTIEPDVKDLIAASKFLHDVEASQGDNGLGEEVMLQALHAYLEVARTFIPADRWAEYGRAMASNPVLKAIAAKQEEQRTLEAGT